MQQLIEQAWLDRTLLKEPEVRQAIQTIIEELNEGKKE